MPLALFDLDNTLIAGDSDYEWGRWLVHKKKVDPEHYSRMNEKFFQDYEDGTLDIYAYLEFALAPLAIIERYELLALQEEFMAKVIASIWLPAAEKLLTAHREQGDLLVVVSATNRFIVEPICQKLGVEHIIATEPEVRDGRYTGKVVGTPSYREGKVERVLAWVKSRAIDLRGSYFYSDSINDLSLMKLVDHPVAVDPDDRLAGEAEMNSWPVISLRR